MVETRSPKIKTREDLVKHCDSCRKKGQIVGFTSGVFDLMHSGHVQYLSQARARCDVLIVGMNSDASVRALKGPLRPICSQEERTAVVAGLESVSFVFLFDEANNNTNVELLKPDIYFKAGDYSRKTLSSAPIVEKHGGRVEAIEFKEGKSSSAIIERIVERYLPLTATELDSETPARCQAVFLDRDGTINEHIEFLHEPEKFKIIPGVLDALKRLKDAGFRLVVITNQPGIGLGYFTKEDFFKVNREFLRAASKAGVMIDKIYFCPHSESSSCQCRKPLTGMVERAVRELNIDLTRSFMVGDTTIDAMCGKNSGVKTVLVESGLKGRDERFAVEPDKRAGSLMEASEWIIAQAAARPSVGKE